MTSTEPMTYKPGPHLDAQLCNLFGWQHFISAFDKCIFEHPDSDIALGDSLSTSWEGMRLVVEEMQRRGCKWHSWSYDELHTALFIKGNETFTSPNCTTAPHAVCLAALSALQHVSNTEEDKDA